MTKRTDLRASRTDLPVYRSLSEAAEVMSRAPCAGIRAVGLTTADLS